MWHSHPPNTTWVFVLSPVHPKPPQSWPLPHTLSFIFVDHSVSIHFFLISRPWWPLSPSPMCQVQAEGPTTLLSQHLVSGYVLLTGTWAPCLTLLALQRILNDTFECWMTQYLYLQRCWNTPSPSKVTSIYSTLKTISQLSSYSPSLWIVLDLPLVH